MRRGLRIVRVFLVIFLDVVFPRQEIPDRRMAMAKASYQIKSIFVLKLQNIKIIGLLCLDNWISSL